MNPKPRFQPRVLRTYAKWAFQQTNHVLALQRWWRQLQRLKPSNVIDCITLEPVEKPVFLHISDTGYVTAFTAVSLAQCMTTSGNFTHPQFRTPFTSLELWRLDKCTSNQFELLKNRDRIQAEQAVARNEISLDEFLMNEFNVQVDTGIEACTQPCPRLEWVFQMRNITEPLITSFFSFVAHNPPLASQTLLSAIERVEQQTGLLLLSDNLSMYFELCDRVLQFSAVLKTLINDNQ